MSLSLESGSTTSLSQKSQEDELSSTTSGQSSVDLQPPDDSERIAMLTSAVSWIKGELAAMRDCDRGILQQLLLAHSTINDLREQQKNALTDSSDQFMDSSKDTLDDIQELDFESSGGGSFKKDTTPIMATPPSKDTPLSGLVSSTPLKGGNDEDILRDFFGKDDLPKFSYFKTSSFEGTDEGGVNSVSSSRRGSEQDKLGSSSSSNKSIAELKLEAKKEGRSSVAFEMSLFRQQLQEQAKSELAAFDKEFDSTTNLSTLLEPETRSYRHSILNRMDELLYPSQPQNEGLRTHRSGSHIRQSSEPVVFNDVRSLLEGGQLGSQRGSSARSNNTSTSNTTTNYKSHFPTSQSTHFSSFPSPTMTNNGIRKASEPSHSSFRMPTSRTYVELSRSGSGYLSNKQRKDQPHYDTTVVKRKSSSSRNGTLEKSSSKQSLQYSVESLDREDGLVTSPYERGSGNGDSFLRDFESPEHKSVRSPGGGRAGYNGSGRSGKVSSPEVYPEMSSPRSKMVSPPHYLQSSNYQAKWSNNKSVSVGSGSKKSGQQSSTSNSKKAFTRGNSENSSVSSWL